MWWRVFGIGGKYFILVFFMYQLVIVLDYDFYGFVYFFYVVEIVVIIIVIFVYWDVEFEFVVNFVWLCVVQVLGYVGIVYYYVGEFLFKGFFFGDDIDIGIVLFEDVVFCQQVVDIVQCFWEIIILLVDVCEQLWWQVLVDIVNVEIMCVYMSIIGVFVEDYQFFMFFKVLEWWCQCVYIYGLCGDVEKMVQDLADF